MPPAADRAARRPVIEEIGGIDTARKLLGLGLS
jgi:hypothetical protein